MFVIRIFHNSQIQHADRRFKLFRLYHTQIHVLGDAELGVDERSLND